MKDSIVISILGIVQALLTLGYQIFVLNIFGFSNELDIYFASNTINFVLVSISITAINLSITPILIGYYKKRDERKLRELTSSIFNILLLVFLILALLQYFLAPSILRLFLPGFDESKIILANKLFRIQAFLSIITITTSVLVALHYTFNMMYKSIVYPVLAQACQILFVWFFYEQLGIIALLYGLVLSQCLTFVFLALPFVKLYRFEIRLSNDLKDALNKIFPLLLSSIFSKSNVIIDRFFASSLTTGSITLLYYGEKIIGLVSDFVNKGLSLVSLRKFSLEKDNDIEFQRLFSLVFESMIFIVVPVSIMLIFLLEDALNFFVVSSKLVDDDIGKLYLVIISLLGVFVGGSLNSTITNAFYAKGLTKIVAKFNVIIQICGFVLKLVLFQSFGLWGLTIAFSVTKVLGFCTLLITYHKLIYSYNFKLLFIYVLKVMSIGLASLLIPVILSISFEFWVYRLFISSFFYSSTFLFLAFYFEKNVSHIIFERIRSRSYVYLRKGHRHIRGKDL